MPDRKVLSLSGAGIVIAKPHPMLTIAARELSKYLFRLSGKPSPIIKATSLGTIIRLEAEKTIVPHHFDYTADQRFSLKADKKGLAVTGATPLGTLYGVYALLEQLGAGFYLGGDTYPDNGKTPAIRAGLDMTCEPCFAVRGSNLHGNLVIGASGWGEYEWRFYIDQMSRMRCNIFMVHLYANEPGVVSEINGVVPEFGRPHSSMNPAFGIIPMRTSEFFFGTDAYFDQEIFGSEAVEGSRNLWGQNLAVEDILRKAIRYGRLRGVSAVVGFEVPARGDCTDECLRRNFQETVRQFVRRYPELPYFCLWQSESLGLVGMDVPESVKARKLIQEKRHIFEYLGGRRRIYAGIILAELALLAYRVLQAEAPGMRMVVCGWGGDRWHRFADYAIGLDKLLPDDVVFTCHDNSDPTLATGVSKAWGQLPSHRQRWAQVWIESDVDEMWTRQPNVESLGRLLPDALAKQCQGSLALHWRTGDFEEELGYLADFAWNPRLTTEEYYRDCASRMYGVKSSGSFHKILSTLQKMGPRWTGIYGGLECASKFTWTGRTPHPAYEVDRYGITMTWKLAEATVKRLNAYGFAKAALTFSGIAKQLKTLFKTKISPADFLKLNNLKEEAIKVYEYLVTQDTPIQVWEYVIKEMEFIHYLLTRADLKRRTQKLIAIRNELAVQHPRNPERLNWLQNTIDVILALDRVSVALADPGPVVDLLAQAKRADQRNSKAEANRLASQAYRLIVKTNIQEMLLAQTRKLNTECEWGVLALLNLKALPAYWDMLARAEALMPAVPPREVYALVAGHEVRLYWKCIGTAKGYHVYRRLIGKKKFRCINRLPVPPSFYKVIPFSAFIDRPPNPGEYEYAVTARDDQKRESPFSHGTKISFGLKPTAPRILGRHQDFCLMAGQSHEVRVVIPPLNDDVLAGVVLKYRRLGEKLWHERPMLRQYGHAYHAAIPAVASNTTAIQYYVEASTKKSQKGLWPETVKDGRYWTATVLSGR